MKYAILNVTIKQKKVLFPKLLAGILTIFVIGLFYVLIFNSYDAHKLSKEEIVDSHTPESLPDVPLATDMFTLEWLSEPTG
ncbi:hypothetical protein LSPH26S_00068 [Lysinibacillus sphaericus]